MKQQGPPSPTKRKLPGIFAPVLYSVYIHPELTPTEKLVWGRIHGMELSLDSVFISAGKLAKELGLQPLQGLRILQKLEALGLLIVERSPGKSSRLKTVIPLSSMIWVQGGDTPQIDDRNPYHPGSEPLSSRIETPIMDDTLVEPNRHLEENTDSDILPANRKKRDSQSDGGFARPDFAQQLLSDLVEKLLERKPNQSSLGRIISATPSHLAAEAVEAVEDARRRGYGKGHPKAPRSISWFVSTILNYWQDRERRALPPPAPPYTIDPDEFNRMTDAIEIDSTEWERGGTQ